MFSESDNVIEVNDGGRIIIKNVSIGALPNGIQKKYDVIINNLQEKYTNNPNLYFISYNAGNESIGISRSGYLRYCNIASGYLVKFMIDNSKFNIFKLAEYSTGFSAIYDLLGNKVEKISDIAHHDMINIKRVIMLHLGNSVWGGEDTLIEFNHFGNILKQKNFGTLIKDIVLKNNDPNEISIINKIVFDENNKYLNKNGQAEATDWCHANSLVYDSETDILYASSRNRGVLAIDYSEWKLIWYMVDDTLKTVTSDSFLNGAMPPYQVYFKDLPSLEPYKVKGDAVND